MAGLGDVATSLQNIAIQLGRLISQTALAVVIPITQGGTGATTAAGALANLGVGSLGQQNANAAAITGGTVNGSEGSFAAFGVPGDYQVPLTGFTIAIPNGNSWLNLDPAGTLAAGTVVMAALPVDGQDAVVSSTQIITALTVSPSAGQALNGPPTTIAANRALWWRYRLTDKTWYRLI